MAFREVPMFEVREVLRLWLGGEGLRAVARLSRVDRSPLRRCRDRGGRRPMSVRADDAVKRLAVPKSRGHKIVPVECEAPASFRALRVIGTIRVTGLLGLSRRVGATPPSWAPGHWAVCPAGRLVVCPGDGCVDGDLGL